MTLLALSIYLPPVADWLRAGKTSSPRLRLRRLRLQVRNDLVPVQREDRSGAFAPATARSLASTVGKWVHIALVLKLAEPALHAEVVLSRDRRRKWWRRSDARLPVLSWKRATSALQSAAPQFALAGTPFAPTRAPAAVATQDPWRPGSRDLLASRKRRHAATDIRSVLHVMTSQHARPQPSFLSSGSSVNATDLAAAQSASYGPLATSLQQTQHSALEDATRCSKCRRVAYTLLSLRVMVKVDPGSININTEVHSSQRHVPITTTTSGGNAVVAIQTLRSRSAHIQCFSRPLLTRHAPPLPRQGRCREQAAAALHKRFSHLHTCAASPAPASRWHCPRQLLLALLNLSTVTIKESIPARTRPTERQREGLPSQSRPENTYSKRAPTHERVDSLDPCKQDSPKLNLPPPLHLLTEANLRVHTRQTNPEMPSAPPSKVSSNSHGSREIFDDKEALRDFGAVTDTSKDQLPPELQAFMNQVIDALREDPPSPNAKNLHRDAELARLENEADIADLLNRNLMFAPATVHGGEKYVKLTAEANLELAYVTRPATHSKNAMILSQPRPDYTNGYLTIDSINAAEAKGDGHIERPFTEEQEMMLLHTAACPSIHRRVLCPWLTVQYKAFTATAAELTSQLQCCRDGIAVNAYLQQLFECAGPGFHFDTVDTCHWSMACNGMTVQLFLHYRVVRDGKIQYRMRCVTNTTLEGDLDEDVNAKVVRLRRRLRNILNHAQTTRLERIRSALSHITLPSVKSSRKIKALTVTSSNGIGNAPSVVSDVPRFSPSLSLADRNTLVGSPQNNTTGLSEKLRQSQTPAQSRHHRHNQQSQGRPGAQPQQGYQAVFCASALQAPASPARLGSARSGQPDSSSAPPRESITTRLGRASNRLERYGFPSLGP
ncbi:hypothetical protein SVAN01_09412 [Stagonosporopsis vannaccii]|nr:hypothetical protein SVAN01_09412 [Stagonosporopsis vannaccii]